jgi:hypothetical protein
VPQCHIPLRPRTGVDDANLSHLFLIHEPREAIIPLDTVLYAAFAVGYIALFIWGVAMARRANLFLPSNVLPLVIVALIYDNLILATGHLLGEGALLESLHGARFWLHAFLTPSWLSSPSMRWVGPASRSSVSVG